MNRLNWLLAILMLVCTGLQAQEKNFKGLRIFINPGHGGHDSDDRHMKTTDFWESEGNLEKGLYLRDLLSDKKAVVFLSRTTNRTEDDLDFNIIDEMANAANVDFFLSIHSNGGNGQVNRPLVLYRGTDAKPLHPVARSYADSLWQKLYENGRSWTQKAPHVKGDLDYYPEWGKAGLGVLRQLAVPGVLTEGSFHDFLPESWRMRNQDFLHLEAWAMYHTLKTLYGVRPSDEGVVAGVVRSAEKKSGWKVPNGLNDKLMPLNGALVRLLPGNKSYQTDTLKNGFFSFERVPEGSYQLIASDKDGLASDTVSVVVRGDRVSVAELFIPGKRPVK